MRPSTVLLLLGILLGATACSHPGKDLPVGSYERGIAEYEGGRVYDAVEDLKLFIRRNPTDPRVDEAQYHVGLARMKDEDYPVAAVEFEILRADYPNSELVEDAWYMEGLCYVEQVPDIHLEQTVTRQALAHFQRYLREFPQGKYRAEAVEQVDSLQLHLDRKRMAAVQLYRRLGRPRAAMVTLEAFLQERPDSQLRPRLLFVEGELHEQLDEPERAREAWTRLVREHPDDEFADRARSRLAGDQSIEGDGESR